jgi:hypothetical protein
MDDKLEKRRAIRRRLEIIETTIDGLVKSKVQVGDNTTCKKILNLELELQILTVYYDLLDDIIKNPNYLLNKDYQIKINPTLLDQLDGSTKVSLVCLTEGLCGIK